MWRSVPLLASAAPILGALVVAAPAAAQSAPGARAFAMGGTGVAVAEPYAAAFANPALVRFRDEGVPRGLGSWLSAAGGDPNGLQDRIDTFQDTLDELQARIDAMDPGGDALRPILVDQLQDLDGREAVGRADSGVSAVLPLTDATVAFSGRLRVEARLFPRVVDSDVAILTDPMATPEELDALDTAGVVYGAETTEFGVTVAREARWGDTRFSIGVTPKFASIDVTNFVRTVSTFEDDDLVDDLRAGEREVREEFFNVDAGIAVELEEGVLLGLAVRDAIRRDVRSSAFDGPAFTYRVRARPTAGLAVSRGPVTFTAEADLRPARPFSDAGTSQFVRMGGEASLGGRVFLRAGFAHDLRDTFPDVFSAGIGGPTGLGIGWSLGAQIGEESAGAALEASFSF
ncbi:MAG: conjugal transfer protein TraF [Planctomycetota bacterium]